MNITMPVVDLRIHPLQEFGSTTATGSGSAGTTSDTTATLDTRAAVADEAVTETEAADVDAETVIEEPTVVATTTPADTRERVRTYIIREKLSEAVNTTTDTVLDKERKYRFDFKWRQFKCSFRRRRWFCFRR